MKVYNQSKTKELTNYDLALGHLTKDKIICTIPAVTEIREQGHYVTIQEYPNGGKDVEWVIDVPGREASPATTEEEEIYVYNPYTASELQEIEKQRRILEIEERLNALSQDFIQSYIGELVPDIEGRKNEFLTLHNELRHLLGKPVRERNKG